MKTKEIIKQLVEKSILFSKKTNTKVTQGVKAFQLLENGSIRTGGVAGSNFTNFKVGEIYEISNNKPLEICKNGFHFYETKNACFGAKLFGENTVFHEIIAYGKIIKDTETCVSRKIKIGKRIKLNLDNNYNSGDFNSGNFNSGNYNSGDKNSGHNNLGNHNSGDFNSGNFNSGNRNSGHYNSGDFNSGNRNSGNRNSGHYNSGNCNSGNYNSGNYNSGYYNSGDFNSGNYNSGDFNSGFFNSGVSEFILIFNKLYKREDLNKIKFPEFLSFKIEEGETYKEAFQKSWNNASPEEKKILENIPNFDWNIFTEISGIKKPNLGETK